MFASCVFPVHVWSILNLLKEVPAWVLRLSSWELVGVIAYTQAMALLESVMILLILILLAAILPAWFFRDKFVAQGSMWVLLTSGWTVAAHYNYETIRLWHAKEFLFWVTLYLISIGVSYVLIHRYKKLQELVYSFAERLTVLSLIYVSIDFLSVAIVALRNI
jgi:hypothetical protein